MYRIVFGMCCFLLVNVGFAQGDCQKCMEDRAKLTRNNRLLGAERDNLRNENKRLIARLATLEGRNNTSKPTTTSTRTSRNNNSGSNKPRQNSNNLADKEKMADLRAEIRTELSTNPATLHRTIDLFNNQFDTYVVDLRNTEQELKFFSKDENEFKYYSLGEVKKALANQSDKKLVFSMNGGMYDPNYDPKGLLIEDGKVKQPLDIQAQGGGNFYLKPNGVFLINKQGRAKIVTTEYFEETKMVENTKNATQSGPMLLIKGEYHKEFNSNSVNLNIRNGVGIIDENRVVFAISRSGVTFYDFATLFKNVFECSDALFLDGSVSKMYCPDLGRTDSDGNFGTIIGLVKKK